MKRSSVLTFAFIFILLAVGWPVVPVHALGSPALIGVSVHSLTDREANLVKLAGVKWIRADVAEIPGSYSFSEISLNAQKNGIKMLGILDIWTMKWNWSFNLDEWERSVRASVATYNGSVDAWEIWNEPGFASNPITPERYYDMLRIAYPIIKNANPRSVVLMGGGLQLYTGGDTWLARDEAFAKRLFELGADGYADAISFHTYPWARVVDNWVWSKYDESLSFYRSLFKKQIEIWITETGQPAEFDGEQGQAKYLGDVLSFFATRGVNNLFWYELRDNPKWTTQTPTFGLLSESLKPRLAFLSLQESHHIIINGTRT